MSLGIRISQALAANAFGQMVTIGSQLLLTPLYFLSWGPAQYGEWLLLSTIPAYLVMADIGVGSAAGNEMAMLASAGDYQAAQRSFWGAVRLCHFASLFCIGFSLLAALLAASGMEMLLHEFSRTETASIVVLLGAGVCVNFYLGMVTSGFRSSGRNALGVLLSNCLRLAEFLLAAMMLALHFTPLHLCIGLLVARCAGLLLQALLLSRHSDWIFVANRQMDRKLLGRLLKPSLSFLAFPLGNAMALQGPVMIVGLLFGSTAVAAFSTLRTLSRVPLQVANVFNASVWPEMSAAFGANNFAALRMLHQRSWLATLALGLLASGSILFWGQTAVTLWLGHAGIYDAAVLGALVACASLASIWGVSSIVMTATNAHSRLVVIYLLVNCCCLGFAYLLGRSLGMTGFLAPLVLAEFVMVLVVYPMALRASGDTLASFMQSECRNLSYALHLFRA